MTVAMTPAKLLRTQEIPTLNWDAPRDRFDDSWRDSLSMLLGLGRAAGADFVEFFSRAQSIH